MDNGCANTSFYPITYWVRALVVYGRPSQRNAWSETWSVYREGRWGRSDGSSLRGASPNWSIEPTTNKRGKQSEFMNESELQLIVSRRHHKLSPSIVFLGDHTFIVTMVTTHPTHLHCLDSHNDEYKFVQLSHLWWTSIFASANECIQTLLKQIK